MYNEYKMQMLRQDIQRLQNEIDRNSGRASIYDKQRLQMMKHELYQEEMKACHMPRPAKKYQDMTDDEIAKSIEEQFAHGRKMLDVKEKYYKEFKKVLNIRQIQKIYKLERSNMHRLGKEMNHRKNMKPQMGNRRPDKK